MKRAATSQLTIRPDGGESETPFVSVVLPVYNDPDGVETTLESLTSLHYPDECYEILVVDNDSTDETPQVIQSFADDHTNVSMLVERDVQSSYAARNRAVEVSRGDILAFIDADMHVEADWLEQIVDVLAESGADYIGCDVELYTPGERTAADHFDKLRGFDIERYINKLQFAPTCCLVVRREVFETVGSFDDRLVSSGDMEFGNRVADAGFDIHFAQNVTMYHPTRSSLRSNMKKAVRIGRGRYQLSKYYPERYGSKFRCLLNPAGYLPPVPWLLSESFRGWESLSLREKAIIYAIATVASMGRSYGRVSEALETTSTSVPPENRTDFPKTAD